jgi:hypothetical protein
MADKYERWNKWAPQFIADLMHDFGLKDFQAAGFVGNFAAESAYFNDIVEDGAIAKGWAGGTGFAQWTAVRRKTFEAWIRKKGWKADSYEGNYSYLFRELSGLEKGADYRYVIPLIKASTTPENAAWRVAHYFERPKTINLGPRAKAAKEALELYRKNPVPPTVWATDIHEEVKVPTTSEPNTNVVVMPADPAKPVVKSIVVQGVFGGVVIAAYAIVQEWQPGVPLKQQPATVWYAFGGLLTALWTLYGRLSSNAQPLTWTQAGADEKAAERTISGPASAAGGNVTSTGAPVISPVSIAQQPTALAPATVSPVANVEQGLQQITGMLDVLTMFAPQLKVFSTVLGTLAHAVSQTDNPLERGMTPFTSSPPPRP